MPLELNAADLIQLRILARSSEHFLRAKHKANKLEGLIQYQSRGCSVLLELIPYMCADFAAKRKISIKTSRIVSVMRI
jgi:hypothetical protein